LGIASDKKAELAESAVSVCFLARIDPVLPGIALEELLAERGLHADHVTVWRWVQAVRARIAAVLTPPLEAHQ
jgi:transposase-like protein